MRSLAVSWVLLAGCHLVWPFDEVSRPGDGAIPSDGTVATDGPRDGPSGDAGPTGCRLVAVPLSDNDDLEAVQGIDGEVWIVGEDGLTLHLTADGQWDEGAAGNQDLRGLWLQSAQDGWAVGDLSSIQRLQGGSWSPGTTNASVPQVQLNAVWGSSPDDLWAVGGKDGQGYVLRYDDAEDAWRAASLFPEGEYFGVWGPSSTAAWAVGTNGSVIHLLNTTWLTQSLPPGVKTGNDLRAVWGLPLGDFWIVGDSGTILYHQSGGWTAQTLSQLSTGLSAVHGRSSSDVWAVGNGGAVLHQEGGAWKLVTSGTSADLNGVWVSPDKPCDGWVVGDEGTRLRIAPGP